MMVHDWEMERREAEYTAYENWCLAENLEPEDDHWAAFEQDMDAAREDHELAMAEDRDW